MNYAYATANNATVVLVAAVAGKKVVVYSFMLHSTTAAVGATLNDSTAATARARVVGAGSVSMGSGSRPVFETASGQGLQITGAGVGEVTASVVYTQIEAT